MNAIDKSVLALLPEKLVADYLALPFAIEEGYLCVGFADPRHPEIVAEIERTTNMPVKPFSMILITGPTGSGKTTTPYAFL
jgi:type II secretory ATPase GspE/PulE/Tfp pilus assembly ATPase PilB-like protein